MGGRLRVSLRFGVLGTGYWAGETHAAGIVAHAGAELVGVWGRNPAKAEALGRRFGVRGYEDLDALRAARAGRHLLLDKPLALSLEQARSVVEAAEAGGVASVIFFTWRFKPRVVAWLEALGSTGGWQGAQGTWFGSIFRPGSPYAESAWRQSWGALWDVGPHVLSLAIPALGPVERVTAARGLGDTVHLLVGHRGGAASTLSVSLTVPEAAETTRFAVHGTAGWSAVPSDSTTVVEAFGEAISQLAGMIAAGTTEHPCDVRFGAEVVAILDAAERVLATPPDAAAAPIQWRR